MIQLNRGNYITNRSDDKWKNYNQWNNLNN